MAAATISPVSEDFDNFLLAEEAKDILKFTTAGSVDDGKSTMIGRLLYDSRNVYEDQLESVTKASAGRNAGAIDFSLLTDGLRAEREQGITIDVAHRYFATPRRKFIIADTPGHEQYTRNMVTGASTADLAIILVDARKGLLPQSRRHAYIASLLGLPNLVIAVNKMDLVSYDEQVFKAIERDFREFLSGFETIAPYFVPISALAGDNVVKRSTNMPWFEGESLLEYLEQVPADNKARHAAFRFPVQRVVRRASRAASRDHTSPGNEVSSRVAARPEFDVPLERGYAGSIASGEVRPGDKVTVLPSGRQSAIAQILSFDGDLEVARTGEAVTLILADEIDISRGDVIVPSEHLPEVADKLEATIVWLNETPAQLHSRYRIKHNTRQDWAELKQIVHRVNINTLEHEQANTLEMNAIGVVHIETARPLSFDRYTGNRTTGSFILIDPVSNATVAAGLIAGKVNTGIDDNARGGVTWKLENGALIFRGLDGGSTFSMAEGGATGRSEMRAIQAPETLELFKRLLDKLHVTSQKKDSEHDAFPNRS